MGFLLRSIFRGGVSLRSGVGEVKGTGVNDGFDLIAPRA